MTKYIYEEKFPPKPATNRQKIGNFVGEVDDNEE